jgi:hypothetical protein
MRYAVVIVRQDPDAWKLHGSREDVEIDASDRWVSLEEIEDEASN